MAFTASSRRVRGLTNEVDINGRHTLMTDEPTSLGGSDTGPAPHELLPAALAACISTTVSGYAARKEWKLRELKVDVTYDPDARPRKFKVSLHLPDDLSDEQTTRLREIATRCPVRRALAEGFEIEE